MAKSAVTRSEAALPVRVSQELLRRIMSKEFPPGSVLPSEREIGETYTVSRPVAREAIKLLAARGLVTVHPRQGATVGQDLTGAAGEALLLAFHQADAVQEEILQLRALIEPQVAALAAYRGSLVQRRKLVGLQQLIHALLEAINTENAAQVQALWDQIDQPLHVLLGDMSQNAVYKVLVEIINTVVWTNSQEFRPTLTGENVRLATHQHLAICDAVLAGDGDAARAAMTAHLEYTFHHIHGARNSLHEPMALKAHGSALEPRVSKTR